LAWHDISDDGLGPGITNLSIIGGIDNDFGIAAPWTIGDIFALYAPAVILAFGIIVPAPTPIAHMSPDIAV
jgi:hypothetical protein